MLPMFQQTFPKQSSRYTRSLRSPGIERSGSSLQMVPRDGARLPSPVFDLSPWRSLLCSFPEPLSFWRGQRFCSPSGPGILDLPSRLSSPLPGVCWDHTRKLPVRRVPLPTRCCRTGRNLPISHPIAFPSSRTVPWDHTGSISSINKAKMPNQKTVDAVELSQTWGGCAGCRAGGNRTSSEGISWHHAGVDLA